MYLYVYISVNAVTLLCYQRAIEIVSNFMFNFNFKRRSIDLTHLWIASLSCLAGVDWSRNSLAPLPLLPLYLFPLTWHSVTSKNLATDWCLSLAMFPLLKCLQLIHLFTPRSITYSKEVRTLLPTEWLRYTYTHTQLCTQSWISLRCRALTSSMSLPHRIGIKWVRVEQNERERER